jgi:hypothetical protein
MSVSIPSLSSKTVTKLAQTFLAAIVSFGFVQSVSGQIICDPIPSYPSPVASAPIESKTYRLVTRDVVQEVPVTTYKEVVKTEMRTETCTEQVPVRETSTREETITTLKPITETKYREETIERTDWESSTQMQEERITSYKPVTETSYRDETTVYQKPVTSTTMVNESVTTLKPVTTYNQQLVDYGGVQNQMTYQPGNVRNRINWVRSGYMADPRTGQLAYQRGGLRWVPQQGPGVYQVRPTYVPNVVQQVVPTTTYQPQTQVVQRPVTSTQYVNETVTRKVPVTTRKLVPETVIRQVPVTVRKPVLKREVRRIPYQETRYVSETSVRKVPVENVTYKSVTRTREIPVRVVELVPVTEMVKQTRRVSEWVLIEDRRVASRPTVNKPAVDERALEPVKKSDDGMEKVEAKKPTKTDAAEGTSKEADAKPALTADDAVKATENGTPDTP